MKLIDTHFHLDFYRDHSYWFDQINSLEQYTLCVTNSPEIYYACKKKYSETRYVRFALGYNPQVSDNTPFNKKMFLTQLRTTKYVGEVGLDFSSKNASSKSSQIETFSFICENAAKQNKLLTVHSRKAEKDTLDIMVQNGVKRAILHWYTGDLAVMEKCINAGYYFSVNTNMCYSAKGRSIIMHIPPDRLLVESDGPFSRIGMHRYTPANLKEAYSVLSDTLGEPNLGKVIFDNFNRLLSL